MKRYQYKVFAVFAVTCLLLLQYQNCGSSKNLNPVAEDQSLSAPEDSADGDMHVINEVNTGGIQFVQSKTVVSSSDSDFSAFGTCSLEHQGALLSWQLLDESGSSLFKGKSKCENGVFRVDFQGVDSLACGTNLILKAAFGAQAETQTLISKNCN
jgi:hypothetical protein